MNEQNLNTIDEDDLDEVYIANHFESSQETDFETLKNELEDIVENLAVDYYRDEKYRLMGFGMREIAKHLKRIKK